MSDAEWVLVICAVLFLNVLRILVFPPRPLYEDVDRLKRAINDLRNR